MNPTAESAFNAALRLSPLIPLFPFLAFAAIVLFTRTLGNRLSAALSIGSLLVSALISSVIFTGVFFLGLEFRDGEAYTAGIELLRLGDFTLNVGILVDNYTAVMLLVVTLIGSLIFIYSTGYMHGDPLYPRFFAYLAFFAGAMLTLVLADNFALLYVGWELVGLASYLLIGFWFHKPSAAKAAVKAFVTTRVGDVGMFVGIAILFSLTVGYYGMSGATFNFNAIFRMLHEHTELYGAPVITAAALFLFMGAVGKSAQFPLHIWLPDAMEGPTPVSALIHAATMVAAGVYLVGRTYPIFDFAPAALLTVALVGGFTALFAAAIGLVMYDIKKVLAYSTISQLGYMMLALGVGGFTAGIFHLFTHAFFKALLFLCSGSVIIGCHHEQDMRRMGGLRRRMPVTFVTFLIGSLSIAGIFPLAGFWSKDEIIADALKWARAAPDILHYLPYLFALCAALMTAFYMFRLMFLTFGGDYRGHGEPRETPPAMTVPLAVLAFF
ncbi:MAG: NADH-quinone oxidoreductase subunit L, partial [bacterium]